MKKNSRGNVWLGVAGYVVADGKILVVKKRYSGLKGKWSLPAGFVDEGETVDEAVVREVKEETGLECKVNGLVGIRTGVINDVISDNMVIFSLKPLRGELKPETTELYDAVFLSPTEILEDKDSTALLKIFIQEQHTYPLQIREGINPGDHFGYTNYKIIK
ncbi:NUDIX hydrolase [Bacillus solimangrovi]|uniref:NUDIX hydrolase n=1 Tax=Bacillus solimangrovi TaxID=1305675 RepID=A0A1E5LIX8_9BACI|nr:NUDIX domain-containing protein [Bacillus solimangrovi]OEH93988.1 NUDIX hydrolase [Bacillus solimangrovi]